MKPISKPIPKPTLESESTLTLLGKQLSATGFKKGELVIPIVLSTVAALCEGASLSLFAPVLDLMVQGIVDAQKESWLVVQVKSVFPGRNAQIAALLGAVIIFFELTKYATSYLSAKLVALQANSFANSLRKLLFKTYLQFHLKYFDSGNSGEIQQTLTTHTNYLSYALRASNAVIFQVGKMFVYGIIMAVISWRLALLVLAVFPVLHFAGRNIMLRIKDSSHGFIDRSADIGKRIVGALGSLPLIKLYAQEEQEYRKFCEDSDELCQVQDNISNGVEILNPLRDVAILLTLSVLVLAIFYIRSVTQGVGVGKYLVFILILKRSASLFGSFNELCAYLSEIDGPLRAIDKVLAKDAATEVMEDGSRAFMGLETQIELRNLSFNYFDSERGLKNVSVIIPKGKTTALVGRSGAGKSTIIKILARYYDCSPGSVFVDGVDLRNYSAGSWRANIAIVGQDTFLFDGTIRENLLYGLGNDIQQDRLLEALENAHLADLISTLPNGLDTKVGERGVQLSGGEGQRLSIARAFLRDPEIVILDEPTSGLDSQTELVIQKGIADLCKDRTVIVIAHRLSTIKHADQIIVMDHGRAVESGSVEELLQKEDAFYDFWQAQQL